MGKKRITNHSARIKGNRHNDRNMTAEAKQKATNIDFLKSKNNFYYHCYQKEFPELTFAEAELKFYEENFKDYIEKYSLHDRHVKQSPQRMLSSKKTQPEDEIIQIGAKSDHASEKELKKVLADYIKWHESNFKDCKILDIAIHLDETTPHVQIRKCWTYFDEEWNCLKVGQDKCLEKSGIQPPNPTEKISKKNNRKMTYSAMCRNELIEIARGYGLDIEDRPREKSKSGLELDIYKLNQDLENLEQMYAAQKLAEDQNMELIVKRHLKRTEELDELKAKKEVEMYELQKAIEEQETIVKQLTDKSAKYRSNYEGMNILNDRVDEISKKSVWSTTDKNYMIKSAKMGYKLAEVEDEHKTLNKKNKSLNTQNKALKKAVKDKDTTINDLESKNFSLDAKNTNLANEIQELKDFITSKGLKPPTHSITHDIHKGL